MAPPGELKALTCGVDGDLRELPIHLSQVLLEADGWDVINLGLNTPFFAVAEALAKHRPQLLCISANLMTDPARVTPDYVQVFKAATKFGSAIVLGGDGFADSLRRRRFPSEFYAKDFEQLLGFTPSLVPSDGQS